MDSRIAILGANGVGKSTLLNLIMDTLQPTEGTISKHASLKLAKYSQHSADQLPYDKSPIEHFQTLFREKFPEKDVQVGFHGSAQSKVRLIAIRRGEVSLVDLAFLAPTKRHPSSIFQMDYETGDVILISFLLISKAERVFQSGVCTVGDGASTYFIAGYARSL
jgi:ATP-binding cassette, subfamily F, member 2